MATSSFNKHFVIKDSTKIKALHKSLATTHKVEVKPRDINAESKQGSSLLKRYL